MRKVFFSFAIIGAGLMLAGCGNKNLQNGELQKSVPINSSNVRSTKDAKSLGIKMKCEYSAKTYDGKDMKSEAYVEGGKFRVIGIVGDEKNISVFDGENFHAWKDGEKSGMKMAGDCIAEIQKSLSEEQRNSLIVDNKIPQDPFWNETETKCVPMSDYLGDYFEFSVPADVVFADQCEIIKKSL